MKSITFNGIRKDWLYLLEGRQKAPFAPIRRNLLTVPGMSGAFLQSSDIDPLPINQPVGFKVEDDEHALQLKDELAAWLVTDEPVALEFDDEPGRVYYAVVQNTIDDFTRMAELRKGTIQFLVLDGYGYGPELEAIFPSDVVTLTNNGTAEADPVFELEVKEPVTFAMVQNQDDEYMMIGQPAEVEEEIVDTKTLVLNERGETLNAWATHPTQVDSPASNVDGSMGTDGTGIVPLDYGTGTRWHGPALIKEISPIQDFEVEMNCRVEFTDPKQTVRIEFYLFDEYFNVLGKMAIMDSLTSQSRIVAEGRYGEYRGDYSNYLIYRENYLRNLNHFYGMLRMRRVGTQFEFYVARLTDGETVPKHFDTYSATWTDNNLVYQGRLKYVQIHIGKFADTQSAVVPRINSIKVYKLQETTSDQIPYIAYPGDVIEFDHKNADILINGESRADLKQLGASFFKFKKGENQLVVSPDNSFGVKCKYRPTYL